MKVTLETLLAAGADVVSLRLGNHTLHCNNGRCVIHDDRKRSPQNRVVWTGGKAWGYYQLAKLEGLPVGDSEQPTEGEDDNE